MRPLPLLAAAGTAVANYPTRQHTVKNVIAFGDSYTDSGRISAYIANNGSAPPPATDTSTSNFTAGGGYSWGHFATQQLGAKFYDYAVSGAFCSNTIFERFLPQINRSFPSVLEDQIPSFVEDVAYVNASTGSNTFYPNRAGANTVYALWIGTNDLGSFLTDSQYAGFTITDFVDCVWRVFDAIYRQGGRRFVLLNQAPLERTPLYAAPQRGGAGDNQYWPTKTQNCNSTQVEQKVLEYSTNVNTMFDYGVPFQLLVNKTRRWPHASFTVFNVHELMLDIYDKPEQYLDAPANVTGYYHHCDVNGLNCTNSQNPLSSFMWYDELHPSEKTDEAIGKEFAKVVGGKSSYATYW
ncbi:acetyl esterase [Apiospora hydei]|uniref:Acetyl esterase n=1 Tax=Apiospora hydei TaxID=1337664 RepID=A0ABR1VHB6_9PEZI